MDSRRFNGRQRVELYLTQNGCCAICGIELQRGWHADHVMPWSQGGITDTTNGQALCPTCNLKKGDKDERMDTMTEKDEWPSTARDWQREAWEKYLRDRKRDWTLCATPGSGKTKWALWLIRYLLDHGTIERVVIVTPTQSVRDQWAEPDRDGSTIVDLEVVHNEHGGIENSKDFEGCVVTYAQVASQPKLQRRACELRKTLVVFDEIHHAGFPNRTWGDQIKFAFEDASYRVALTGTPWRRPGSGQIPFVIYDEDGKVCVDYQYEYGRAVGESVCRSVEFRAYTGEVECVDIDSCTHRTIVYTLEDEDDKTKVLRDLLKPDGQWMHSIIDKANTELMDIRCGEDSEYGPVPDAKGIVFGDSQHDARIISKYLEKITKEKPELIISDEADSQEALERFKTGNGKWAVAVNKVSEGVDVPALYVGVYATRKKTPLNFRQSVGRFVRLRVKSDRKTPREEEKRPAVIFMPAVPTLKVLAEEIEEELRHVLDIEREAYERELAKQGKLGQLWEDADEESNIIPTDISRAELDAVIIGGKSYSHEEYNKACELVERYKFSPNQVTRMAEMLRELNPSAQPPIPRHEEVQMTPRNKYKKALLAEVDRLARKKAAALHVENKEFNTNMIKRFGRPRRELSIKELEGAITWLNELRVVEAPV